MSFSSAGQLASRNQSRNAYAWTGYVPVNRTYRVNGRNQYTSAGPPTFTHDMNGNLTSDGISRVNFVRYDDVLP